MNAEDFITESPIERRMLAALLPILAPSVRVETQRPVTAGTVRYRADICLSACGRIVVVECDGRDFHDFNPDRFRDVAMLDLGGVTDVVRFRGADIVYDVSGCVDKARTFFPFLFDAVVSPLATEDLFAASLTIGGSHTSPIIRCRVPLSPSPAVPCQTANVLGATNDRSAAIVEFKSPCWNQDYHGPRAQPIADCLGGVLDNIERALTGRTNAG